MILTDRSKNTPKVYGLEASGRSTLLDKIYLGFVKDTDDQQRMGRLKVWIPELGGDPSDPTAWHLVNYCSPFAGASSYYDNTNGPGWQNTQRSYGMWFVPPDLDNEVIVAFINGDPARGIWMGCLYQQYMNHMVPGIPGQNTTATTPVAEYNKKLTQIDFNNPTRPIYSPLADQLAVQGLDKDTVRGVTDSGARRDDPINSVYGLLTPGGIQLTFDDNPTNAYVRVRTQSGAQVLINDSVGCVYLNSVDGKNWISMDATGKIDVYANDDITLRSNNSINIRGDLDVNIEAGRDINMRARGITTPPLTVPNTSEAAADQPPVTTLGAIEIIGDSIAVGIGSKIQNALVSATVGANSTQILDSVSNNPSLQNSANTILSVGSNESDMTVLANNLAKIRTALGTSNFIWILPYNATPSGVVSTFAAANSDKTLNLTTYPSNDNIHPRDYALVANDAQQLCVAAPSAITTSGPTGPTGPTQTSPNNTNTGPAVGPTGPTGAVDFYTEAVRFLTIVEGLELKAYHCAGENATWFTIGIGHNMYWNNLAPKYTGTTRTTLNCGSQGTVPIVGANGQNTVLPDNAHAVGLCQADIPSRVSTICGQGGISAGDWNVLGPYQQVALLSYCWQVGNINDLVVAGLVTLIQNKDIQGAAALIASGPPGKAGAGYLSRRAKEANEYRNRPDLVGSAAPTTLDGYPTSGSGEGASAQGSPVSSVSPLVGGYIRMQSQNSMHVLSSQHIFMTSTKDTHRLVGQNLYDSVIGNTNKITNGYMTESVGGVYSVGVQSNINFNGARIDLNGLAPPAAASAANAVGPITQPQTDAIINSIGNITALVTQTILPHLPYHEPYDNHGGRTFVNIRNATTLDTNTGLRDGEVIANSAEPLDLYGTPLVGMPVGVYAGAGYNVQNQPLYNYNGLLPSTTTLQNSPALQVSVTGQQFITSRENGSYKPILTGSPPELEIGYGHTLTPTEISSSSIMINGLAVSLSEPITQQNINDLFTQDLNAVLTWMRPVVTVAVSQTQFDMLASLAFNIGQSNFTNSPAVAALNAGNIQKVPNLWMQHVVDATGKIVQGLIQRRRAEAVNFMSGPSTDGVQGTSDVQATGQNTVNTP